MCYFLRTFLQFSASLVSSVISRCVSVLLALEISLVTLTAGAQDHHKSGQHDVDYHKNTLAMFVGIAYESQDENGAAIGIEYERRINKYFGIGALAEYSSGDLDSWVYVVPFAYHHERWKFYVAPGVEDSEHGNEALLRLGVEYAFEVGGWELSPQLDVDLVDNKEVWVLGVTFGRGF